MGLNRHFFKKVRRELMKYFYLYFGFSVTTTGHFSFTRYFKLKKQQKRYNQQAQKSAVAFPVTKMEVYYEDKEDNAGDLCFHYFFQDLYVAQRIFQNKPVKHIDIGSRIDGFVAHVASYREIEIYDIRPMQITIPNVQFQQCDLMNLSEEHFECTDSISSLHALEHFGLGRYGDDICYDGYLLGFLNIYKMLKQKGKFYFSVPMGKQRTEFHAHRVFSLKYLLEMLTPYYEIDLFSYIDDKNTLHENVQISDAGLADNFGCRMGCAIFELTKK
ncbi:hypothetical protein FACS189413_00510 [Bacteroidia bacterium]|nr:hypothetical protein FACS189463_0150 [Bacteroidia bacterium]GHU66827.1 hypothetical protein FACS189413_00510 [Bacteroidia bacterium]